MVAAKPAVVITATPLLPHLLLRRAITHLLFLAVLMEGPVGEQVPLFACHVVGLLPGNVSDLHNPPESSLPPNIMLRLRYVRILLLLFLSHTSHSYHFSKFRKACDQKLTVAARRAHTQSIPSPYPKQRQGSISPYCHPFQR